MAQTTTSITVAITSPTFRQITLASTTNATVGRYVQIDNELMRLIAVNTTTGICDVERGISSKATLHGINSAAYIGEPDDFGSVGGAWAAGAKYVPKFTDTLDILPLDPHGSDRYGWRCHLRCWPLAWWADPAGPGGRWARRSRSDRR
jgi:hypothetical protein